MRFFFLLLFLTACSGGDRPLQFNLGLESVQLDWNRAIDNNSVLILDNVMEGLTTYSESLEGSKAELIRPTPALAASWSISEGSKVYRFHLQPNVYWTDGVPLHAQQFVDSWRRLLSPGSSNAYRLFDIDNAQAFAEGKIADFSQVGVKAVDAATLEVRLRRPVPYFLHLVATVNTFPIRVDLLEKFGDQWIEPQNLVTLGPYKLAEWVQGDHILLAANTNYHAGTPELREVYCKFVGEPLTAFTFYENGLLDILPRDLPSSFAKQLQSHRDYRTGPKLSVVFLVFNTKRPPLDTASRRRALIQSLQREKLAAFFPGSQVPTMGWIPPGLVGYRKDVGLAAEGRPSPFHFRKPIEMRYSGSDTWNLVFQSIQKTLEDNLHLKTTLEQVEASKYNDFLVGLAGTKKYDTVPHILQMGWVADFPDPHSFMNVFTSTSESNFSGWQNPQYDQLIERAVATDNELERAALYREAQRILLEEEAVLMPLFITSHQALVRSNLRGVYLNVLDKWYFKNVRFESEGWRGLGRSFLNRLQGRTGKGFES